jgi:preprotein translocase subunit YajC
MGGPPQGGAPAGGTDMLMQFLPLILMFAIFWFLLIRPQQKRAKEHKKMLSELKRGDHVLTSSGLVGRILEIDDDEATIECGEARLRVTRGSIGGKLQGRAGRAPEASVAVEKKKSRKAAEAPKAEEEKKSVEAAEAPEDPESEEKK